MSHRARYWTQFESRTNLENSVRKITILIFMVLLKVSKTFVLNKVFLIFINVTHVPNDVAKYNIILLRTKDIEDKIS